MSLESRVLSLEGVGSPESVVLSLEVRQDFCVSRSSLKTQVSRLMPEAS